MTGLAYTFAVVGALVVQVAIHAGAYDVAAGMALITIVYCIDRAAESIKREIRMANGVSL